ncbi:hypothetical protein N7457_001201 [Penicillium paradoxum]|uniref:uncharacterized protein n=1 Tax=Penicillium paradoxum TaxID=176176 RepID=UPI00254697C9|nr:uncharacterized protein N7457_001201 [Penicillium paradoxum]KAJ5794602.1 hypothetical protein N7457_001201 [Penicillium paradoxum]
MSLPSTDTRLIMQAVHTATEDLGFCRNRVWAIAKSLPGGVGQFPKLLPPRETLSFKVKREDHELCTFDFCEQSRVNFTLVKQRHEPFCDETRCPATEFPLGHVEDAIRKGQPTVWDLKGTKTLKENERYMAISHVWSDGTGVGNQAPGYVNSCLLKFFRGFAQNSECKGLWWDTICIPTKKELREKALKYMHQTYTAAAVTLVHDCFLRACEWRDAYSACFYIVMSPWFSRGWTALELKMSQKVQIIFNSPSGPITKDLDKDILQANSNHPIPFEHEVAKGILNRLRGNEVGQLNDLVAILGSRHTSWPRDMAIISGLMIGIELPEDYAHQKIYQEILQTIGKVSHAHLFHNSATMTNGYNWCPTNLYDLPVTLSTHTLQVEENGNLFGEWNVVSLDLINDERFIIDRAHPLIEAKVLLARQKKDQHFLLVEPDLTSEESKIGRALLVQPSVRRDGNFLNCYCDYIGPVYFHPPLMRSEIEKVDETLLFNIHVGYDEKIHNGSGQSTETETNIQIMIQDMKSGSPNMQYKTRKRGLETFDRIAWDRSKLWEEFKKAAIGGDHENVEHLLLNKALNLNQTDQSGWSVLHHAVWNGQTIVAKLLVKKLNLRQRSARGEEALHLAADRGNEELMTMLLKGSTPNLKRKDGLNALHLAAMRGFTRGVEKLLQDKWNINTTDLKKQTALHMASSRGHEGVVHALTKQYADHTLKDRENHTALSLAVYNGHEQTAKILQKAGANVDIRKNDDGTMLHQAVLFNRDRTIEILGNIKVDLEARDKYRQTALHLAAERGQITAIKILTNLKADIEAKDEDDKTPLHLAAQNSHISAIKILANLEADLEARDKFDRTPLHIGAERGQIPAIKTLMKLKVDIEAKDEDGKTPLHLAAKNGQVSAIKTLAKFQADLEARDKYGETPLHTAAENGHVTAIKAFANLKVDLEAQDRFDMTPLHLAAESGHVAAIKTLADFNLDLEAKNEISKTPLHIAARKGQVRAIEALANLEANLEARDKYGQTPLHLAAEHGHVAAIEALARLNVDIEAKDEDDKTPLHIAAENGEVTAIKVLVDLQADLTAEDEDGQTPLDLAIEKSRAAAIKLLTSLGQKIETRQEI